MASTVRAEVSAALADAESKGCHILYLQLLPLYVFLWHTASRHWVGAQHSKLAARSTTSDVCQAPGDPRVMAADCN
jgi:hypothetical protein